MEKQRREHHHRVRGLDGIRGLAILMVMGGHAALSIPGLSSSGRNWVTTYANSSAGVRLFFVLSGYLITTLLVDEFESTGTISLARFYFRRALRILPAFYCFLAGVWIAGKAGLISVPSAALFSAATFVWNYAFLWLNISPDAQWTFGHLWTLALEQQFYLLWPLLLLAVRLRSGAGVAALIAVWCPIARIATYFLFPPLRGYVSMMFHTASDSIMIGCLTALLIRRAWCSGKIERHASLVALLTLVWLLIVAPTLSRVIRGSPIAFGFTLEAIAASGLIAVVHRFPPRWLRAIFARGALPLLGLISYSLYLWQQVFLAPGRLHSAVGLGVSVACAFLFACASYYWIEQPALRLKGLGGRAPRTIAPLYGSAK